MIRPSTIAGLAAVTLALLAGCGKEEKSGSPCRDAYIEKFDKALTALEQAEPGEDFEAALTDAIGGDPEECKDLAPGLVADVFDQVASEFEERMAKLDAKFPQETPSPDEEETDSPSDEASAGPSAEPSADGSASEEESPSPSPTED